MKKQIFIRISEDVTTLSPYAKYLTKNESEAEELVHETQFRALCNADKFREDTNLRGWLRTIMKNIFINKYRTTMRHNMSRSILYKSNWWNTQDSNRGEAQLRVGDIQTMMDEIDVTQREAFMLYFEGYKYHEIAELKHIPLGTVKSRIFLARKNLSRMIDKENKRMQHVFDKDIRISLN